MLKNYIKRALASTTPWVFNQHSLPTNFTKLEGDDMALKMINNLEFGFISAYNSIQDFYIENNQEALKDCLEPILFKKVSENLKELQNNGIEFRKLSGEINSVIPLSFFIYAGISTDRLKNSTHNFDKRVYKLRKFISNEFMKKITIHSSKPLIQSNVVSIEIGFYGKPALGIFKGQNQLNEQTDQNEFHIIKFEGEVLWDDIISFWPRFSIDLLKNISWSICDIDFILKGNELLNINQDN